MVTILVAVLAYSLGSINSAILLCGLLGLPNPRKAGSGNPGATNVLRIAGRHMAAVVLLFDALKGLIPVLIGSALLGLSGAQLAFVLLAACVGHTFPVFFNFDGGKGIATLFGGLLGLSPFISLLAALIWLGVVLVLRYVSLGSILVAMLSPFLLLLSDTGYFVPMLVTALLLIWNHRGNIHRIRLGKEKQIGSSPN